MTRRHFQLLTVLGLVALLSVGSVAAVGAQEEIPIGEDGLFEETFVSVGQGNCFWTLVIDWGDGHSDTYEFTDEVSVSHQYSGPGEYTVVANGSGVPLDDYSTCTSYTATWIIVVAGDPTPPPEQPDDECDPNMHAIARTWDRTDRPVEELRVSRTWMWGADLLGHGLMEPYAESPDGERCAVYFDKSRMEVNDPHGDQDSIWFVTNGLLVVEMVDGKYQLGDNEFDHSPSPADVPIGGDPINPDAPTYADINIHELRDAAPLAEGSTIVQAFITSVVDDYYYEQYGVTAAHRVQVDHIDHTVASVFWDFMNSDGMVYEGGSYPTDQMFINPFYATGLPITEAYWSNILVGGERTDVLWQCFERRCLTYNPENDEGWHVEAANVGQHYYYWRYGERPWED